MALENKLGITNSAELAREEERLSKKKALELYDASILDGLEAGKFWLQSTNTCSVRFMTSQGKFGLPIWQREISASRR